MLDKKNILFLKKEKNNLFFIYFIKRRVMTSIKQYLRLTLRIQNYIKAPFEESYSQILHEAIVMY